MSGFHGTAPIDWLLPAPFPWRRVVKVLGSGQDFFGAFSRLPRE
jgi:hypothetical protein